MGALYDLFNRIMSTVEGFFEPATTPTEPQNPADLPASETSEQPLETSTSEPVESDWFGPANPQQDLYAGPDPAPATAGTVAVTVHVKPSDLPQNVNDPQIDLSGFAVSFGEGFGVTDGSGAVSVTASNILPYKTYYVTVSKAGYVDAAQPLSFTEYTNHGNAGDIAVAIQKA